MDNFKHIWRGLPLLAIGFGAICANPVRAEETPALDKLRILSVAKHLDTRCTVLPPEQRDELAALMVRAELDAVSRAGIKPVRTVLDESRKRASAMACGPDAVTRVSVVLAAARKGQGEASTHEQRIPGTRRKIVEAAALPVKGKIPGSTPAQKVAAAPPGIEVPAVKAVSDKKTALARAGDGMSALVEAPQTAHSIAATPASLAPPNFPVAPAKKAAAKKTSPANLLELDPPVVSQKMPATPKLMVVKASARPQPVVTEVPVRPDDSSLLNSGAASRYRQAARAYYVDAKCRQLSFAEAQKAYAIVRSRQGNASATLSPHEVSRMNAEARAQANGISCSEVSRALLKNEIGL